MHHWWNLKKKRPPPQYAASTECSYATAAATCDSSPSRLLPTSVLSCTFGRKFGPPTPGDVSGLDIFMSRTDIMVIRGVLRSIREVHDVVEGRKLNRHGGCWSATSSCHVMSRASLTMHQASRGAKRSPKGLQRFFFQESVCLPPSRGFELSKTE
jgi:hypothetical protein